MHAVRHDIGAYVPQKEREASKNFRGFRSFLLSCLDLLIIENWKRMVLLLSIISLMFFVPFDWSSKEFYAFLTDKSDFVIKDVTLSGIKRVSREQVMQALALDGQKSIIGWDVEAARARLLLLPFVKNAIIKRSYSGEIYVHVEERRPYAIWQEDGQRYIIDGEGKVLAPYQNALIDDMGPLPYIAGKGANLAIEDLLRLLEPYKEFTAHIVAYTRVNDRRWDLLLDNNIVVKLPAEDIIEVLQNSLFTQEGKTLLKRDITAIDLRLKDRITVSLSDTALAERKKKIAILDKERRKQALAIKGSLL